MVAQPTERETRETVTCRNCELRQFRSEAGECRRCGQPLLRGTVEARTVIVVPVQSREVVTMREAMRRAAVLALEEMGGVMRACEALSVTPNRLKQMLREAGDVTDYRTARKARREGRA